MGAFFSAKRKLSYKRISLPKEDTLFQENISCFLQDASLEAVARYIKICQCENIVVLSGGEMSENCWVSDLLFTLDHIHETNLPHCRALFDYDYFSKRQEPLFEIMESLLKFPDEPNAAHFFIRLLHDKGILRRHYTENMDNLDLLAGLPEDKLVQANGSYHNWKCTNCSQNHPDVWFVAKRSLGESPNCLKCDGLVRPDIVFFNKSLPSKFFKNLLGDMKACDLMIVLGTSLFVEPFSELPYMIRRNVPRLFARSFEISSNLEISERDIFWGGSPADCCMELVRMLDWAQELNRMRTLEIMK